MKKILMFAFFLAVSAALVIRCNKKDDGSGKEEETILKGVASISVDETVMPMVEDQIAVFESDYDATINMDSKSEAEVINDLTSGKTKIAIISRVLNNAELKIFENRKINPKQAKFAIDGIALIRNRNNKDTLISLSDVVSFLKGEKISGFKGLVFDNPNSSSIRQLLQLSDLTEIPKEGIFSFNDSEAAIKYVAENDGMVGVVGMNWLYQPSPEMQQYMDKISILSVKGLNSKIFVPPTQNALAEGNYPLARDLFIVNCQGFTGLGMGFSSFIAGERGQRIILKSGLLPVRLPGRKIQIRNQVINENIN